MRSRPTMSDRWDTKPPQTTPILPSLPVANSVLRQLGISDYELPRRLARLKHNLLLSPSHTPWKESNICPNSGLSGPSTLGIEPLLEYLYDTIRGPDAESKKKTFNSMYYLDQIAIVCLAAGLRACQSPGCLHYRRKLERLVPVCHSWPGLRDWVLCITSCSLRAMGEMPENGNEILKPSFSHDNGTDRSLLIFNFQLYGLLHRLKAHLAAIIVLTAPPTEPAVDIGLPLLEPETLKETVHESGSIGGPRPDQTIYSHKLFVSSRGCPRFTPEFLTCRSLIPFPLVTIAVH